MKRDGEDAGSGGSPPSRPAAAKPTETLGAEVVPIQPVKPEARKEETACSPENEEAEPSSTDVPDDLTPEKILRFEAWSISKLADIKTQKAFNLFWEKEASERLKRIEPLDKVSHDRIKGHYAACQAEIKSGKAKAS